MSSLGFLCLEILFHVHMGEVEVVAQNELMPYGPNLLAWFSGAAIWAHSLGTQ